MLDGRHTGTGGGNHVTLGGADRARQPAAAPPGPAAQPHRLLAEPSRALLSLLGHVHRPHEPEPARGRGARRHALRAGDRLRAARRAVPARRGERAAVARRPDPAQLPRRPHRQHAPRRVLDRQALRAGHRHGTPRAARVPRLRDAAAPAHEPGADAAAARARRALLEDALPRSAGALGHAPARRVHAAALRRAGPAPRGRGPEPRRLRRSATNGSRRSSSSASRATAR